MKRIALILLLLTGSFMLSAQHWAPVDQSPLDLMYYPVAYPSLKVKGTKEPCRMRVIYSRPQKKGRKIFGSAIVPYGKVWRLGANEATELDFFTDVKIGGKRLSEGRYTLYALVEPSQWTFILNKETDVWGAFTYDPSKDVVRVSVPVLELEQPLESFTFDFEKTKDGVDLVAGWDTVSATLPIRF